MILHLDYSFNLEVSIFGINVKVNKSATGPQGHQTTNKQDEQKGTLFITAVEETIRQLEVSRSKSTVDNYRTALRSFLAYTGNDMMLSDIDVRLIEGYQRWLQDKGVTSNTSSCYMRSLRALLQTVNPKGEYMDMFKNVFTGKAKTVKRAIREKDIAALQKLDLTSKPTLQFSRDLFIFCFYAMGMPFVDLAYLKRSHIKSGFIEYERRKTGQQVRVKIEPPMQEIINRYARKDSNYLFPILTATSPKETVRQYETARGNYNRRLKKLAKMAGIPNLTSYVARHSWASMANESNIELSVISKAMGHASIQTTLIYIRDISDQRVYESNHLLIRKMSHMTCQEVPD